MDIKLSGSLPSKNGSEAYVSGTVRIDAPSSGSGNLTGAIAPCEPGARAAWHTHPLGQTLLVVAGLPGAAGRRTGRGDPPRRHRLVRGWREVLARCAARLRDDPYRHRRNAGRQGGRLDG